MARIRSIKPEFPQSESMGRVSRDARLLFIQLWTQADDEGRFRGHERMLASLLFPYDDDAPKLIGKWLAELEREGCIRRYVVEGAHYLDIPAWAKHQKIEKPTPSRLPSFAEASPTTPRTLPDKSALDLGPWTVDQEPRTVDRGEGRSAKASRLPLDWAPSESLLAWTQSEHPTVDALAEEAKFRDYWHARAGPDARKADWDATWRNWIRRAEGDGQQRGRNGQGRADEIAERRHAAVKRGLEIVSPLRTDG